MSTSAIKKLIEDEGGYVDVDDVLEQYGGPYSGAVTFHKFDCLTCKKENYTLDTNI
jgi:hypothetical protein